jgi:hypothetical protein
MSIFEDKKHNDPAYIGQKPVVAMMVPEQCDDYTYKLINHGVEQPMSVRNVRNAGSDK